MRLFQREKPPESVTALLKKHERVVAWADTRIGPLVATNLALFWPGGDEPQRIPWETIDHVLWRTPEITVTVADIVDDLLLVDRPPISLTLTVERDLPKRVHDRVRSNVVRTELVAVHGGYARVVGRKQPGRDGLLWLARLEPGTSDSHEARADIRAAIAEWDQVDPNL